MTQPKLAQQRGSKRLYQWRDESFWSVTTIIAGGVPKPVLVNWAKKFTSEYAVDNLAKLNALCEPDSDGNIDREGAVDWLKGAAFRDRDKKADLGTSIHTAIEAHTLGKPQPPWPVAIKPKMAAFLKFLEDFSPEFLMSEASVFSRTEHYAGTLDAIVKIRATGTTLETSGAERTLLLDFKTGKGVYPESALQLAAYRYAEFVGAPDGSEQPLPECDGGAVVHLTDEGYELVEVVCDADVFKAFLYVREVFRWQDATSKGVILPAMLPVGEETLV